MVREFAQSHDRTGGPRARPHLRLSRGRTSRRWGSWASWACPGARSWAGRAWTSSRTTSPSTRWPRSTPAMRSPSARIPTSAPRRSWSSAPRSRSAATCRCWPRASVLGGFGLTEPGAGSDAGGTATHRRGQGRPLPAQRLQDLHHPRRGGRDLRRHGAHRAGHGQQGNHQLHRHQGHRRPRRGAGSSASATRPTLPKTKGVRAGKKEDKMGWRASDTRELIFEDAVVPEGEPAGRAWARASSTSSRPSTRGRIGIAALSLGIAEGAYEEALALRRCPKAVRPADRELPGCELPAGRHGDGDRGRHAPPLSRRLAQAEREAVQEGGGDGQAVLLRARHARRRPRRSRSSAATATPPSTRSSG